MTDADPPAPAPAPVPFRPLAVCVCRERDRVLVEWGRDHVRGEDFLRAIGGGIELGESPEQAVRREYREELDAALEDLRLVALLDNRFVYEGSPAREMVFVFTGRLDGSPGDRHAAIETVDAHGHRHVAEWLTLDEIARRGVPLHPEGLAGVLRRLPPAAELEAPGDSAPRPAWFSLLAALPDDATPERRPVASPELRGTPAAAAIEGWEQVTLERSLPGAGLRALLVVLDATGRTISASDLVHERLPVGLPDATGARLHAMIQHSVGGRFEPDGSFLGTCWRTAGPEPSGDEEPDWGHAASAPTAEHAARLAALAAELVRRSG